MGIGTVALKALRLIPRYAFSDGVSTISKARKATIASGTRSVFGKNNEFALKNSGKKISAGWDALKKDALKTMNSKRGVWASLKSFGKSLISKPKAGIRLVEKVAAKAGKTAGFWAKTGGALKGLGKALKKLPIVGTLFVVGFEIPDIYDAFSRGGAWEGTKQILKSSARIAGFAAGTAIGTVIGGPIGGLIGGLAGDMLVGWITGGSYSENHPKPEKEKTAKEDQQNQATDTAKTDTPSSSSATNSSSSSSSALATSSGITSDNSSSAVSDTTSTESVPYPSSLSGVSNQFGTPYGMSGLAMGTGMGLTNPFGTGMGLGNPFGAGLGMAGGFGYPDATSSLVNSILAPGENIFQKYPMGYGFQYMC